MGSVRAPRQDTREIHRLATTARPKRRRYTLVAVREDGQWASLCAELDIASCGATAAEALDLLERAITEALGYEREAGVSAGGRVPDADMARFMERGRGPGRTETRTITV
jgi:predicted RNase H-like HicB family nuclease